MKNRNNTVVAEVLSIIGSAFAAAASVRERSKPGTNTLRALGIDPAEFGKIRRDY